MALLRRCIVALFSTPIPRGTRHLFLPGGSHAICLLDSVRQTRGYVRWWRRRRSRASCPLALASTNALRTGSPAPSLRPAGDRVADARSEAEHHRPDTVDGRVRVLENTGCG